MYVIPVYTDALVELLTVGAELSLILYPTLGTLFPLLGSLVEP